MSELKLNYNVKFKIYTVTYSICMFYLYISGYNFHKGRRRGSMMSWLPCSPRVGVLESGVEPRPGQAKD